MTTRLHPSWCTATEPDGHEEHVSETLHAAGPDDLIDIRVRKTQPEEETDLTMIEVEFFDGSQVTAYPLALPQARVFAAAMGRLIP